MEQVEAMVREVKDRWLEQLNNGELVLEPAGKYDVTRVLPQRMATSGVPSARPMPLLPAA